MPNIERLRELLTYDHSLGRLRWAVARGNAKAGDLAGSVRGRGYRYLNVDRSCLQEHRVVWAIINGEWPEPTVDHIDRDPLNNRIENLRIASRHAQQGNRRGMPNNITGVRGVRRHKNSFRATIYHGNKAVCLGLYATLAEAADAYRKAAIIHFGEFYSEASA